MTQVQVLWRSTWLRKNSRVGLFRIDNGTKTLKYKAWSKLVILRIFPQLSQNRHPWFLWSPLQCQLLNLLTASTIYKEQEELSITKLERNLAGWDRKNLFWILLIASLHINVINCIRSIFHSKTRGLQLRPNSVIHLNIQTKRHKQTNWKTVRNFIWSAWPFPNVQDKLPENLIHSWGILSKRTSQTLPDIELLKIQS